MRAMLLVGILSLPLLGCSPPVPPTLSAKADQKPLPTRDELRKQLMGKTADEVLKLLGKPERTTVDRDGGPGHWTYEKKNVDPVTEKIDSLVFVYFKDGKVESVRW